MKRLLPILAALPLLALGCAQAAPSEVTCARAPREILDVLEEKVPDGELRNGNIRQIESSGYTFVSAELLNEGEDEDSRGDTLTWVTGDVTTDEYFAVDAYARDNSEWPHAPFDVREKGAIESRGCVNHWAGEPEETRDQSGDIDADEFDDLGF